MGEYAKGYRYEDTVLIGVDCSFENDGSLNLPVCITDVIAHHRKDGLYYRGLEVPSYENRPIFFPYLSSGTYEPEERDLEMVRKRDPRLALWTSREVDSFPYAKGFYTRKDLVGLIASQGDLDLSPLRYHETLKDGNLVGFGNYHPLMRMMLKWHEIVRVHTDLILRAYCKGEGGNTDLGRLTGYLCSLGPVTEEDVMRVLLAVGKGINNDQWLQTYWKMVGDKGTNLSLIREKSRRFREAFLSME